MPILHVYLNRMGTRLAFIPIIHTLKRDTSRERSDLRTLIPRLATAAINGLGFFISKFARQLTSQHVSVLLPSP